MTKMDTKSAHQRSCANSSALSVQRVWRWPDVPCSGSGSPALGALPPETTRKQPGEPPKIDLQGVDGIDEARDHTPPAEPPFIPTPAAPSRHSGRGTPPVSAITTSLALYATLYG